MATERQCELVAKAYNALTEILPGFNPRQQQKDMVRRVVSLTTKDAIGLIEAPTGTGKSLGYLIPGGVTAITEDKILIVSTATASLQDQLATKDVPIVVKALSIAGIATADLKCAVIKGRERHLCPAKLELLTGTKDMFNENDEQVDQIRDAWDKGDWNGIRDTIPITVAPRTWAKVSNTSATCTGDACNQVVNCPYFIAMAHAKESRIIIVNHDYLLTMLANVENSFLCDSSKNIYIFDEAHHLGDKILSAFASTMDFNQTWRESIMQLEQLLGKGNNTVGIAVERLLGAWLVASNATQTMLGDGTVHRFALGEAPSTYNRLLLDLLGSLQNFFDVLDETAKYVAKKAKLGGKGRDGLVALTQIRISALKSEVANSIHCITEFTSDEEDRARWLSKGRQSLEIRCSPFNAAEIAKKHLWPKINRAILTSATLSTFGSFDSIKSNIGLPREAVTLKLDSPLDYSRSKLIVPKFAVEGTDPNHAALGKAFFIDYAIKCQNRSGILVYFTNKRQMDEVYNSLTPEQQETVLVQGKWAPSAMIEEHKRRIDAGQKSILCGLDSISEGVDLPGEYCTRVLIHRLPFPSPDDPVLATHSEYLKRKGLEPFSLLMLPRAALKLAQVVGRLIRREGDWGDVIVLDRRLSSKAYGRRMASSTPFLAVSAV